jgi:hypothetical protein
MSRKSVHSYTFPVLAAPRLRSIYRNRVCANQLANASIQCDVPEQTREPGRWRVVRLSVKTLEPIGNVVDDLRCFYEIFPRCAR